MSDFRASIAVYHDRRMFPHFAVGCDERLSLGTHWLIFIALVE